MRAVTDDFIDYMFTVRRRSERTLEIYRRAVESFCDWSGIPSDANAENLEEGNFTVENIRNWRHSLLNEQKLAARTVNQQLSALSSFCRYLYHRSVLKQNPFDMLAGNGRQALDSVKLREEKEKRISFFPDDRLQEYFDSSRPYADGTMLELYSDSGLKHKEIYDRICARLIISFLYSTGLRRAELISLNINSIDYRRGVLTVRGKGGKTRQIALVESLVSELREYEKTVNTLIPSLQRYNNSPLLVTFKGERLYPVYVDRAVKAELSGVEGIRGRKSPHVLRHSLATELLKEGADIYSVGRFLGHSSIAATQIYTHGDIKQLKQVYEMAFPRAEKK